MSVFVKTSQVLRKAQRAGFMGATLICWLIYPLRNNFSSISSYPFFWPQPFCLKAGRWMCFIPPNLSHCLGSFSLNFCIADLHVSVFIRPAMNLDKSGWSLEWVKMQCQDTSSWSYLVNPLVLRYVVLCWIARLPFRVGLGMWRSAGLVSVILAQLMQYLKILCDLWDFLNAFLQLNFLIALSVLLHW